jgi:hypothetical protein
MNKIEELISKLPGLCGARGSWGRSGKLQYLDELEHPEYYPRIPGESFSDRCESYVAFAYLAQDTLKADYGIKVLELADASAHGDVSNRDALKAELATKEHLYPDIQSIISVEEAAKVLAWSPGEPAA